MLINLKRLYLKFGAGFVRLARVFFWMPARIYRFSKHVTIGCSKIFPWKQAEILSWWQDFSFLALDLIGIPEIAETLLDFLKWNTRTLSPLEKQMASTVFGDAIKLNWVRIDENAVVGCRKRKIAYVSFFTVNSWGKLPPATLVHELVHVWQFQHLGSSYISQALRAQRSRPGYNYGGLEVLKKKMEEDGKITDFNLEQQAEIIGDYFLVREGMKPIWGKAICTDLTIYEYFVSQVRL